MKKPEFLWTGILLALLGVSFSCSGRGYDLGQIRAQAEAFDRELTLSWWETDNYGRPSRFTEIYDRYKDLFTDTRLIQFVHSKMEAEVNPRERRRLEYLHGYLIEEFSGHTSRELDDLILDIQAQEELSVEGLKIAFREVDGELFNSSDRAWRGQIYRARGEVIVSRINPLLQKKLGIQRQNSRQFGYDDFAEFQDHVHSTDFGQLAQRCEELLYQTELIYRQVLMEVADRELELPLQEVRVYDRPRLFRGQNFDEYFPPERMVSLLGETLEEMGIVLSQQENIDLDTENRPEKEPRPACYIISVPEDIRVLVKPMGGAQDYKSLFHEMGHAQHYAHTEVPEYEFRVLGEDGVTETYAFLFENLFMNEQFLEEKLGMPAETIWSYLRAALMSDLSSLRYYCALFLFERSLHAGVEDPWWVYRDLWERARLTPMSLPEAEMGYLVANEDFYSVGYLEAWLLEAQLREILRDSYGSRWFADPQAGQFLKRLWAMGSEKSAQGLSQELGYQRLDTAALRREIERLYRLSVEGSSRLSIGPLREVASGGRG